MALQILALAFVIGITAMQSIYGLFSGMIMVFCSIVAAVAALGFFEPLVGLASNYIHPSYAAPGALVVVFILTLVILRVLADNLIRGNIRLPKYVDTGGAAVCGFISAQICVGILMMGMLLLPLGERTMMYSAYEERSEPGPDGRPEFKRVKLWTRSDGFTASLISMLSNGSLRAELSFADVYPDFPQWVAWSGNTVQVHTYTAPTRDKGDGFKALKVAKWWQQNGGVEARYRKEDPRRSIAAVYEDRTYQPESGNRLIGVTLDMGDAILDRNSEGRQAMHRFRPTMLRLVGKIRSRPVQYFAQIIGNSDDKAGGPLRIVNMNNNFATKAEEGSTTTIDAYFEVDRDFTPAFVEYRRFARAALIGKPGSERGDDGDQASANTGGTIRGSGRGSGGGSQSSSGIMRFVDVVDVQNSGDIDDLPFSLNRTAAASGGENPEFEGRLFVSGRIFGDRSQLRGAGPGSVRKMKIPDGYRICQIRYSPKKALSLAGRVFNTVGRTLNQYSAVEEDGRTKHLLAGYYAIVKRGSTERFELFFKGGPDSIQMNFRGMLDFKDIRLSELTARDDAILGLIFLVPKGVTITGVENQKGQGVKGLNLRMGG